MMLVYVSVEIYQGVVGDVTAYTRKESVEKAERRWLKREGITDDEHEGKSQNGTEFIVRECQLKP